MSVFVTGGLAGLGRGLAEHYAAAGHIVGVLDLSAKESVELPKDWFYAQGDVTRLEDLQRALSEFREFSKEPISLVIANAGRSLKKQIVPDKEDAYQVFRINIDGVFNTALAAREQFVQDGGGQLCVVSSLSAFFPGLPTFAVYGASKSAVLSLARGLGTDWKKDKIDVTVVAPGFIETALNKDPHHRPFKMSVEQAVKHCARAIEQKKRVATFPGPLGAVAGLYSRLPLLVQEWIIRKDILSK